MKKSAPVYCASDSLHKFSAFIKKQNASQVFILVDENTRKHCYPLIKALLPKAHQLIQIKSGEQNKNINTCEKIWNALTKANADRKSLLVNLGGGVLSDIGGFSAACYKRGIQYINLPTSLLAMVDASVGAKTGIDFNGYKNQIGLFNQPEAVFVHTGFLKTLTERHLKAGLAEVIKHYLIADRKAYIDLSEKLMVKPVGQKQADVRELDFDKLVSRNISIKKQIVAKDPFDNGIRKSLNFGHTIGHAVETHFLNKGKDLIHGEAVAIGILCEAQICVSLGLIPQNEFTNILLLINSVFKNLPHLKPSEIGTIIKLIDQDKKKQNSKNNFSLLKYIGSCTVNNQVEISVVKNCLKYYSEISEPAR